MDINSVKFNDVHEPIYIRYITYFSHMHFIVTVLFLYCYLSISTFL